MFKIGDIVEVKIDFAKTPDVKKSWNGETFTITAIYHSLKYVGAQRCYGYIGNEGFFQ